MRQRFIEAKDIKPGMRLKLPFDGRLVATKVARVQHINSAKPENERFLVEYTIQKIKNVCFMKANSQYEVVR